MSRQRRMSRAEQKIASLKIIVACAFFFFFPTKPTNTLATARRPYFVMGAKGS